MRHLLSTAANEDDRIKLANFGGSNFRSDEVGPAFQALQQAGVLKLIYPTSSYVLPIVTQFRRSPRVQLLDTGLLNYVRGIQSSLLSTDNLSTSYRGRIAQHIVTQTWIATHHVDSWTPHFWAREKSGASAEVDLVLEGDAKLYPLEIKAGPQGRLRSLHQYLEGSGHPVGAACAAQCVLRRAGQHARRISLHATKYSLLPPRILAPIRDHCRTLVLPFAPINNLTFVPPHRSRSIDVRPTS